MGKGNLDPSVPVNVFRIIAAPAQSRLCLSICVKQLQGRKGSVHLLVASGPITRTAAGEALLWLAGRRIDVCLPALPDDRCVFPSVCLSSTPEPAPTASPD